MYIPCMGEHFLSCSSSRKALNKTVSLSPKIEIPIPESRTKEIKVKC